MSSEDFYIALTSKNIQKNYLELKDYITIDKKIADKFLKRSKLHRDDVILSYTGEYRRALKLYEDSYQLGPNVCRITPNKNCSSNSAVLSVFLNSSVGQSILNKEKTLSAQPTVAMSRIRKIPFPKFSDNFQKIIENIINKQYEWNKESIELYEKVKHEFDDSIIYNTNYQKQINYNIKSLEESLKKTKRLDAEYYQAKYDNLYNALGKIKTKKLKEIVIKKKSIEPGTEFYKNNGIPFVRVSNLFEDKITETNIFLDREEIKDIEQLFPKKDTILFSKDGSIGIAYKLEKDLEIVTSSAILHLNIKNKCEVLPDYLALVLNSEIVKLQAERDASGAIIQHWKPSEIDEVIVPIFDFSIQEKIANKANKSFELKRKAKQFLEIAQIAIEIAIKENEEEAIKYIKGSCYNEYI